MIIINLGVSSALCFGVVNIERLPEALGILINQLAVFIIFSCACAVFFVFNFFYGIFLAVKIGL